MPGKHNAGGCGCCGEEFTCCSGLTAITISGLVAASCPTGCDARNGTWAYRAIGDPITPIGDPPKCTWEVTGPDFADNCPPSFPSYIGTNCGIPGYPRNKWTVNFLFSGGVVTATVDAILLYHTYVPPGFPPPVNSYYSGAYVAQWQDTQASCGDFATLPLVYTTVSVPLATDGCNQMGDPGDICNLHGATVGLA